MDIPKLVREMGVVGAGGGGFPTHLKISHPCDVVIANGTECEPLLCNDKLVMEEDAESVVDGLRLAMVSTGAGKGVIALKEKNTPEELSLLRATADKEDLDIFYVGDYYPAGDEFLLVQEILGRVVPEGSIPLAIGAVVLNVETLKNIADAVRGKPVISRTITCGGEVRRPSVLKVPVGTTFQDVFHYCGGVTCTDYAIVMGGPMMGSVVTDPLTPVNKTTTGLFVLPGDHMLVRKRTLPITFIIKQSKAACCQCTYCTELCPRYLIGHDLVPHKIMRQINLGLDVPPHIIENAFLCSECGLCEVYACPMELSPRVVNQAIKDRFMESGYRPAFSQRDIQVEDTYLYRKIPGSVLKNRLHLYRYDGIEFTRIEKVEPERVELLLKQHAGESARAVVQEGDLVKEGDLMGECGGEVSARVHASINGRVTFVDKDRIFIEREKSGVSE